MGSYFQENDTKINPNLQEGEEPRHQISKSLSEASKRPEKASSISEEYNLSWNQNQTQNDSSFKMIRDIPEEELMEIIERGFRLKKEVKISLKKYYESTDPWSLFQLRGYSIKYESVRHKKFYQTLKENDENKI